MKKNRMVLSLLLAGTMLFTACSNSVGNDNEKTKTGLQEYSENLIDVTNMTAEAVFMDVTMERYTDMRGLAVEAKENVFYISQSYGNLPSDLMVGKVEKVDGTWTNTEWMHAYESGYGALDIEKDKDGKTYLWMESNGTQEDMGKTISRVEWDNKGYVQREYGETFTFDSTEGYLSVQVDEENDWVVVRVTNGDEEPRFDFYDRTSMLEGEEPVLLHSVTCPAKQNAISGVDDSKGRYGTVAYAGFTVGGGYIYQLRGNAIGRIYVAAFDLEGNLVYCHLVTEYPELMYRAPEALSYTEGKLYMLLTSGDGNDRLATVLTFVEGTSSSANIQVTTK